MGSYVMSLPELFQLLLDIDEDLANQVRDQRCPRCGGRFHCGDFPRKPRGCLSRFLDPYSKRTSFDCSQCRHRTTPPSVRFLPHQRYVSAVMVLVTGRRTQRESWLARLFKVSQRTVERWRHWWRQVFPTRPAYRSLQGQFLPPLSTDALPFSLYDRVEGADRTERLKRFFKLLVS